MPPNNSGTFISINNSSNGNLPNVKPIGNIKFAQFGNWTVANYGNAPARTAEENIQWRQKSWQNYIKNKSSQKNSYKTQTKVASPDNNENENENVWAVNTNTNEWNIKPGNNNSAEVIPKNLKPNRSTGKLWQRTRKGRRASRKTRKSRKSRKGRK